MTGWATDRRPGKAQPGQARHSSCQQGPAWAVRCVCLACTDGPGLSIAVDEVMSPVAARPCLPSANRVFSSRQGNAAAPVAPPPAGAELHSPVLAATVQLLPGKLAEIFKELLLC